MNSVRCLCAFEVKWLHVCSLPICTYKWWLVIVVLLVVYSSSWGERGWPAMGSKLIMVSACIGVFVTDDGGGRVWASLVAVTRWPL